MLWEGDQVDCYGRCLELLREHRVEVWMRDREAPGFHCRLENPGESVFKPTEVVSLIFVPRFDQQSWLYRYYSFPGSDKSTSEPSRQRHLERYQNWFIPGRWPSGTLQQFGGQVEVRICFCSNAMTARRRPPTIRPRTTRGTFDCPSLIMLSYRREPKCLDHWVSLTFPYNA